MRDFRATCLRVLMIVYLACGGMLTHARGAETPASVSSAVPKVALTPAVAEAMGHLEPLWASMKSDVVSCEARFRKYFQVKPLSPLAQEQVHEILQRHDLGIHPEHLPEFLREVAGAESKIDVPVRLLFIQGQHRKHDMGLLCHVNDDQFSFVNDRGNKQIHLYERGRCPTGTPGLELFRAPLPSRETGYRPGLAEREGGLVRLISVSTLPGSQGELRTTNTVDWATGVVLNRRRELNGKIVQEVDFSGLTTFAGGITFPRCTWTAQYANGQLQAIDLAFLDEVRFNETIPESEFLVSKPEGWHVLDFREQANGAKITAPLELVNDVRTLIPSLALNPSEPSIPRDDKTTGVSYPKRALLILNGLALITLGVWMWRRASLKEPNH
jgi:hypothetical protein